MKRLASVDAGRKFTREEMNERREQITAEQMLEGITPEIAKELREFDWGPDEGFERPQSKP
jgi:hypothetical protein